MAAPARPQPAFTALFDNVSKDPFNGTYGPLFAPFNISLTDANPTPDIGFVSTAFPSCATKLLVHPPSQL